jgi:hypothetical protein
MLMSAASELAFSDISATVPMTEAVTICSILLVSTSSALLPSVD